MTRVADAPRSFAANVTAYGSMNGVVTQSTTSFFVTCLRIAKNILVENRTIALALRANAFFSVVQVPTSTTRGRSVLTVVTAEWAVPEITRTSRSAASPSAIAVM